MGDTVGAFATLPDASAACNCEVAKLGFTKTTELESTMVFGLDAFDVDDLLEFFDKEIGPALGEVELSDLSAESSVTIMAPEGTHTTYSCTNATSKSSYIRVSAEEDHHLRTDYDFAELDWLSKFVEDSYSTGEHLKPDLFLAVSDKCPQMSSSVDGQMKTTNPVSVLQSSNTNSAETSRLEVNIPGRARSKRCRSGVRIWSSDILTSNSTSQESSIYDTSFISFDSSELYSDLYSADSDGVASKQDMNAIKLSKPTKERKYRKKESNTQNTRRCSHCLTERTPQWRAGPSGPKTLCNACGVRYKSGRLVPEYRPAASPTFVSDVHSNSHRKVLEMRRQKEINVCTDTTSTFKAN